MNTSRKLRRRFLQLGGLFGLGAATGAVKAHHTDTHFADASAHQMVYQCNRADPEYIDHILFSAGELLRKYGDDIEIIIAAFGAGIHLLGINPGRPITKLQQQRVASLNSYGVAFHACGNTMKSLGWEGKDIVDFAKIVEIGVDDIMLLQEKGFSYLSW